MAEYDDDEAASSAAAAAAAVADFDAMFAGVSLVSLLLHPTRHLHPIDDYPHDSFSSSTVTGKLEPLDVAVGFHDVDDKMDNCLPMCPAPSTKLKLELELELELEPPTIISTTTSRASARRTRNLLKQREQRRSIAEKMKCLRKLMPWHRKRDHASLLEEAGNYILFLEAQVSSLMSLHMPMPMMPVSPPPLIQYHQQPAVLRPLGVDSGTLYDVVEDYSPSVFGNVGSFGSDFPSPLAFTLPPPPLWASNYYYQ